MITESQIYWMMRCDSLHDLAQYIVVSASIVAVVSAVIAAIVAICMLDENENPTLNIKWAWRKLIFPAIVVAIIGLLIKTFIPTTKEMALIKVAPVLANSELVQTTIPNEAKEIYGLAKAALVEKLKGETK